MEKGSTTLLIILIAALLLGGLVTLLNPMYRRSFAAQLAGKPAEAPIWKSNADYYPDVQLAPSEQDHHVSK